MYNLALLQYHASQARKCNFKLPLKFPWHSFSSKIGAIERNKGEQRLSFLVFSFGKDLMIYFSRFSTLICSFSIALVIDVSPNSELI